MADRATWLPKLATGLIFVLIVALVGAVYELKQFSDRLATGLCGVTVGRVLPAPNAQMVLVSYVVSCGATTPISTQVIVMPAGAKFARDVYPRFVSIKGEHDLVLRWINSAKIEIAVPRDAETYVKESKVGEIAVTYTDQ